MDKDGYRDLTKARELWVADEPRVDVEDFLDRLLRLNNTQNDPTNDYEMSEAGWQALYLGMDMLEKLESAAIRGASPILGESFAHNLKDYPVPELDGIPLAKLVVALITYEGEDPILNPDVVAAFRVMHHQMIDGDG